MDAGPEADPLLWAKHLDWCSARIAERLLALTPDEIYLLAASLRAGPGRDDGNGADGAPPSPTSLRPGESRHPAPLLFHGLQTPVDPALIRILTEAVRAELDLPSFVEWAALYRADPGPYDAELIGFRPE
jgi:hypothetical protein